MINLWRIFVLQWQIIYIVYKKYLIRFAPIRYNNMQGNLKLLHRHLLIAADSRWSDLCKMLTQDVIWDAFRYQFSELFVQYLRHILAIRFWMLIQGDFDSSHVKINKIELQIQIDSLINVGSLVNFIVFATRSCTYIHTWPDGKSM